MEIVADMKKWRLLASIFQLCIGVAAVAAYIVIAFHDELLGKWTVTLVLAIAFIGLGIIGIADWVKEKKTGGNAEVSK